MIGPSGGGKSTLLRCLNRLDDPTSGQVVFDGRDLRQLDPRWLRSRVVMVGQQPVFLSARVRDDIGYGLEVTEQELGAVCERVGLPAALLNRPSSELSVGQAQRASIARALVRQPAVLLLDEPTAPLDRDSAMTIEAALQDMMARGATVILVTHDLEQARRLASQAVLLADGRMRASGDVQTVTSAWDPILWS